MMAGLPPRTQVPCSKVELRFEASHLLDKDITSKSDPCCVLYMQIQDKWQEVGRTENIQNCLDPKWEKSFELDYYFEEVQKLKIAVFDIDNSTVKLDDDDHLGSTECTLGEIVSNSPFTQPLYKKSGVHAGKGLISVYAEEVQGVNDILTMTFRAEKLDKKDTFSKSDPYLEFMRQAPNGQWQVVLRTEVVQNNLNPTWRPTMIKTQKLCAGDFTRTIKVDCYDYDSDGSHDFIGTFTTTTNDMIKAVDSEIRWDCINPKKKAKKSSYKNSGVVVLTSCKVSREYSFLDFIFGGMQINFTVGIDYTASNGDPRSPESLHYMNPYQPNEYLQAIQSVGAVIQDYDTDKMFPALGFGAKTPPNMAVSHEFAINFNPSNPFCAGVQGIVDAYKASIGQVQLYGPTNFSPIINHVARFSAQSQQEEPAKMGYFVLLIITDGVISDMNDTREAIVNASALPMSIIIVGVGHADFAAMDVLDGDNGVLRGPSGRACARDIVQFVPFRDFKRASSAELAKYVLAEIPRQVTDYYKSRNIVPNPKGQASAPPHA